MRQSAPPRAARALALAGALVALLAGCAEPPKSGARTAPTAFPVTVPHALGSTTVPAAPRRVVALGPRDADFALALGVVPVGVVDAHPAVPGGLGPWGRAAAGDARPEVVGDADGVDAANVAALAPDLILAVDTTPVRTEYDLLSTLAPTLVAPAGGAAVGGGSWQARLAHIGRALGRSDRAAQVTADLEARLLTARRAHPEFAGKTAVVARLGSAPGAYTSADDRGFLLTDLGFTIPPQIDGPFTRAAFVAVGRENVAMLDTDVAVLIGEPADPLLAELGGVRDGRAVVLDERSGAWAAALAHLSPLNLPYVLDAVVPVLAAAADGDPATAVPREPPLTAVEQA